MKTRVCLALAAWLAGCGAAWADDASQLYVLRVVRGASLDRLTRTYGLTVVRRIPDLHAYAVTGPATAPATFVDQVRSDLAVRSFEPDQLTGVGEVAHGDLKVSTQPLEEALAVDRTLVDFYGDMAWTGYARQSALALMSVDEARAAGRDGEGTIVAIVDSGVDPDHPLLADVLLEGYDFTRDVPGASEWGDVGQSTAAILDGERCRAYATVPPAEGSVTQSTAAILDSACEPGLLGQSTAAILDTESLQLLADAPPLPPGFGHGTMVAGLVHAVAPRAKILPLKAFGADGTGRASDVARAIYYAVESGARVINLSFTFTSRSDEVMNATAYAAQEGRIVVAAAGNEGLTVQRWPAEHDWVVGVGATTAWDTRAPFSNQGFRTFKLGAPGVDVVTTFPGGHYASASGTSFSAPLISGAVALMTVAAPNLDWSAMREVVIRGSYAEIADVVKSTGYKYPQRLLVGPALELAEDVQRTEVRTIGAKALK
jgi:thermitase